MSGAPIWGAFAFVPNEQAGAVFVVNQALRRTSPRCCSHRPRSRVRHGLARARGSVAHADRRRPRDALGRGRSRRATHLVGAVAARRLIRHARARRTRSGGGADMVATVTTAIQLKPGRPPLGVLKCDGCHRRVSSDLGSARTRELVAWVREDGRDWCILCSGRRGLVRPRSALHGAL